jgi:pimeloyl-ACP methyl ester carboxylesterase
MAMSRVTLADGASLSVHVDGSGPDLMLVTGLGGTAAFWLPVLPALSKHFRVIRFDQRGIGESTRGTAPVDIDRLARDAVAVLDHVQSARALLLGHSTGGVILQSMALDGPERIAGLILSGTWARPSRYMTELFRARGEILKVRPREYTATVGFLGHPAEWLDANWDRYQAMLDAAPVTAEAQRIVAERIQAITIFDRSAEIGRIRLPMLVQGAEDDQIVPAFLSRELVLLLSGAAEAFLPTGGHMFPVTRPAEFVATLEGFARRIGHIG